MDKDIIKNNIDESYNLQERGEWEGEFVEWDALYLLWCINQSLREKRSLDKGQNEFVEFLNENSTYIPAMDSILKQAIKRIQSNSWLFSELPEIQGIKEFFHDEKKFDLQDVISRMLEKQKNSAGVNADQASEKKRVEIAEVLNSNQDDESIWSENMDRKREQDQDPNKPRHRDQDHIVERELEEL